VLQYEKATLSSLTIALLILNYYRIHSISNTFINEMLHLLKMSIFPQSNTFPENEYQASSILKKFGLAYDVIHACP
jgi:hypothetical protein